MYNIVWASRPMSITAAKFRWTTRSEAVQAYPHKHCRYLHHISGPGIEASLSISIKMSNYSKRNTGALSSGLGQELQLEVQVFYVPTQTWALQTFMMIFPSVLNSARWIRALGITRKTFTRNFEMAFSAHKKYKIKGALAHVLYWLFCWSLCLSCFSCCLSLPFCLPQSAAIVCKWSVRP